MAYAPPPQFQQPQQYMQPGAPQQPGQQSQPGMPPMMMMLPQQQQQQQLQQVGMQPQIGMQPPQPGPAVGSALPSPAPASTSQMPGQPQGQAQVRVKLPDNAYPGQQLDVPTPDGQTMRITVPPNVTGGHCITMQYVPKQAANVPPPQAPMPQQPSHSPHSGLMQYQQPGLPMSAPALPQPPIQHTAASGSTQTCQTTLPPGAQPGQTLQVQTPDGYTVEIVVPGGAKSGQTITFQYLKP